MVKDVIKVVKNYGGIANSEGMRKEVKVRFKGPKAIDLLIGCGLISAGVFCISCSAFFRGADAYELAECKVLEDLNLINYV